MVLIYGTVNFISAFLWFFLISQIKETLTCSSPCCLEVIEDVEHIGVGNQLVLGLFAGSQCSEQLAFWTTSSNKKSNTIFDLGEDSVFHSPF